MILKERQGWDSHGTMGRGGGCESLKGPMTRWGRCYRERVSGPTTSLVARMGKGRRFRHLQGLRNEAADTRGELAMLGLVTPLMARTVQPQDGRPCPAWRGEELCQCPHNQGC